MRLRSITWRWDRVPLWEAMFAYRALSAVAHIPDAGDVWRLHW